MNDVVEFIVEKNKGYTLKYWDDEGKEYEKRVEVKDDPVEVRLFR